MTGVSVVVAAFNEEDYLPATLRAVQGVEGVDEIWVVDDGSRDRTAAVARKEGARVIRLEKNRGKGAALTEGLRRARGPLIALLDADLGESAGHLAALLAPVQRDEADLVVADFPRGASSRGMGLARRLAAWGLRVVSGRWFNSPLCGQRVLHRRVLPAVLPLAPGWGVEVAMTLDALRAGFRVLEVPVAMTHRVTGRDAAGFIHRARQLWDIAAALGGRRLPAS